MGVCNCSMFCCTLLYVHSSFALILMGKRELVALLSLSSCCLVIVAWVFRAVLWVCLQFVNVVFSDHTHYFSKFGKKLYICSAKKRTESNCNACKYKTVIIGQFHYILNPLVV